MSLAKGIDPAAAYQLREDGLTFRDIARRLGCNKAHAYRVVRKHALENGLTVKAVKVQPSAYLNRIDDEWVKAKLAEWRGA